MSCQLMSHPNWDRADLHNETMPAGNGPAHEQPDRSAATVRLLGSREGSAVIQKILLAIDASEHSKKAIPLAAEIAERLGAEVTVLHVREWVMGPGGPLDEGASEADRLVKAVVSQLRGAGLTARGEVLGDYFGHTARRIVAAADSSGADLIVMGSRGVSDLTGILLGDVAHKVLQLATTPVLVAR